MASYNHDEFYRLAEYYDIAFDFRNVKKECDFIENIAQKLMKSLPKSFIELGCGPSYHVLEFAKRKLFSLGLDISNEMVEYSNDKKENLSINAEFICNDMINFQIDHKIDVAAILMDSTSYLLDNSSFIKHLNCVADALNKNGIYILEMNHPRDVFNVGKSTGTDWKMTRDDKTVHTIWGSDSDKFDPITQITNTTVRLTVTEETKVIFELEDKSKQRCFTANEFKALVFASGRFKIVDFFGSLDVDIPFDNSKKAWRMVPVLQKL